MERIPALLTDLVSLLERRPKMFMLEPDVKSLQHYLSGYFAAIYDIYGVPLDWNFSVWINQNAKQKTSLIWYAYIRIILANGDDELAYRITLGT